LHGVVFGSVIQRRHYRRLQAATCGSLQLMRTNNKVGQK
jgi:hypothetical protein